MNDFNNSRNLKVILDMEENGWRVRIISDETIIANLSNKESLATDLLTVLEKAGFESDQTMLCDFVYDGSKGGTNKAYEAISEAFDEISSIYKYLYVSDTDLSIGEE